MINDYVEMSMLWVVGNSLTYTQKIPIPESLDAMTFPTPQTPYVKAYQRGINIVAQISQISYARTIYITDCDYQ